MSALDQLFFAIDCEVCGKAFTPTHPRSRLCSQACSGKRNYARHKANWVLYRKNNLDRINALRKQRYHKRHPRRDAICEYRNCGKPFKATRNNQLFCSESCSHNEQSLRFYYLKRENYKAIRKRYLTKNAVKVKAQRQAYKAMPEVKEARRVKQKAYYLQNTDRYRNQKHTRRAREKAPAEESAKCKKFIHQANSRKTNVCYYCRKRFTAVPHIDHVVALADGGKHEVGNLCVSCKTCNLKKGHRPIAEIDWLPQPLLHI